MTSKSQRQFVLGKKGQTLIEVVVTMGVALIIITSIVALVNASNRRATIARQATQASKLAQEGMEIVRNIRDGRQNTVKVGLNGTVACSTGSFCTWKDLYSTTQGSLPACLYVNPATSEWNLIQWQVGGNCADEQVGGSLGAIPGNPGSGIFARAIEISDVNLSSGNICSDAPLTWEHVKRISVKVTWESPIGGQEREVISCLADWR